MSGAALSYPLYVRGRADRAQGGRWLDAAVATLCAAIPLVLYVQTLAPGVLDADGGEFQTNIFRLGVSHTGYPLYFLLAKVWTLIAPVGSIAYRGNLFSAVMGGAAAALLYVLFRTVAASRPAAALAALTFAVSRVEWSQAVIPDVYTLNSFLGILVLLAFFLWRMGRLDLRAAVFAYGLSLTHHRLMIWFAPALVVFVLAHTGWKIFRPRTLLGLAAAFVLPLLLYLYIPIRGDSDVGVEYHRSNNVNILALNVFYDLRLQPAFLWMRFTTLYLPLLFDQFSPIGFAAGLIGLGALAAGRVPRGWPEALPARATLWLVLLTHLISAAFGLAFWVVDSEIFMLPALLTFFFFTGIGFAFALDALSRVPLLHLALAGALAANAVLLARANWPQVDLSNQDQAQTRWKDILALPLEEGATFAGPWESFTPLEYFQYVEGVRTDLKRVKLVLFQDQVHLAGVAQQVELDWLSREIREGRAVYLTVHPRDAETLGAWARSYLLVPVGTLWRVLPGDTPPPDVRRGEPNEPGDVLRLAEWKLSNISPRAGELVRVSVQVTPLEPTLPHLTLALRLVDDSQRAWASVEYPLDRLGPEGAWKDNSPAQVDLGLVAPPDLPSREFALRYSMVNADTGETLADVPLTTVQVQAARAPANLKVLHPQTTLVASLGDLTLKGMTLSSYTARSGDRVELSLWWQSGAAPVPARDISLTLGQDEFKVQSPALATNGLVRERYTLAVPLDMPAGDAALALVAGTTRVPLAQMRVERGDRTAQAPAMAQALTGTCAAFGDGIELAGYTLDRTSLRAGDGVNVTLFWHARNTPARDWTVFVHLLDASAALRAQHDARPRNNALPTNLWQPGEYVTDAHPVVLPRDATLGAYRVEAGLYDVRTQKRLPLEGCSSASDSLLLDTPLEVTR